MILDHRRIDIEHHRHVAFLARRHGLFGEAEAVDLGEIGTTVEADPLAETVASGTVGAAQ